MANQVMNSASAMLNEQFNYLVPFLMHLCHSQLWESLTYFALTLAKISPGTCGTVSWSWLINTCLISNFYGDGLNYVSMKTDFLSDHMIWLKA